MSKSLFKTLAELSNEVSSANQAHYKRAAETGKTTHPVEKLDNGGKPATQGAFAAEQAADVKAQQTQLIASADEISYDQEAAADHTGIKKTEIGNDPSQEKNFKRDMYDPGTSHPARADRPTKDAQAKYASATLGALYTAHSTLSNAILADLANGQTIGQSGSKTASADSKLDIDKMIKDATAKLAPAQSAEFAEGYELAAALGFQKNAAEAYVADYVEKVAADAEFDAELVISFLQGVMQKQADEEAFAEEGEQGKAEEAPAPDEEEAPAAPGPEAPMGAEMGGGEMGGGAGEEMGHDEALAALDQALQELGISPEELAAAMEQAQAGGGGGGEEMGGGMPPEGGAMPPEMGGMPPEGAMPPEMGGAMPPEMGAGGGGMPPEMPPGMKLANDIYALRSARRNKRASVAKVSSANKHKMKAYVLELFK